jgi:hypothetical protein
VTTVYVHIAIQGRSLYIEITTAALPPCNDRYRIVDQVDGTGPNAYLRAAWRGFVDSPRTVGAAPLNLARTLVDMIVASTRTVPAHKALVRGFDYGAHTSVRELGAGDMLSGMATGGRPTRSHIQSQEILKYKRIIERRIFAAVLDFLEAHGVDTEEYRQRAQSVLNIGALNTGSGMIVGPNIGQQVPTAASPRPAARA